MKILQTQRKTKNINLRNIVKVKKILNDIKYKIAKIIKKF